MITIRPKSAEVYLIYECLECHCEWNKTPKEVKLLGGMVCSGCNAYSKFEPINAIRVTPFYGKEQARRVEVTKPKEYSPLEMDAIGALRSIGFSLNASKEYISSHSFSSVEEYIRGALAK